MTPFATPLRAAALAGLAAASLALAAVASAQPAFELVPTTLPDRRGHFAFAPADFDGDGDFDLLAIRTDANFLEQTSLTPVLYRNDGVDEDGTLQFVEVAFPAPPYPTQQLGGDPRGEALAWADYDNDGDVDALVATPFGTTLYRNDDGAFTAAAGLPRYSEGYAAVFDARSVAWADVDGDGDLDLLLPESVDPEEPFLPDSSAVVLYRNDGGALVPVQTPTHYTRTGIQVSVGDTDGDGDADLLYHDLGWNCSANDFEPEEEECLVLLANEGGTFAPLPLDFPTVGTQGVSDLADFDGDGDLDLLLAGDVQGADSTWAIGAYLFTNEGGGANEGGAFVGPDTLDLDPGEGRAFGEIFAATFADYDNDGDVDVLVSGRLRPPHVEGVAYVFANEGGAGAFTRLAEFAAADYGPGAVVWADFDGDGDLDYLASGRTFESDTAFVYTTWLYRNDAPAVNAAPSAPSGLAAAPSAEGVALSWGAATDDHTAADALTYNVWVRDAEGRHVVSPMAGAEGRRLLPSPGNAGHATRHALVGLAPGTYAWSVQAVDNAYNAGAFAPEGAFTVGAVAGEAGAGPARPALLGARPNPARGAARVAFDLPYAAEVGVRVYDVLGREVAVLVDGPLEGGRHEAVLEASALPAGTYLVRMTARDASGAAFTQTGRVTLLR